VWAVFMCGLVGLMVGTRVVEGRLHVRGIQCNPVLG
jgi:hypothetical protein